MKTRQLTRWVVLIWAMNLIALVMGAVFFFWFSSRQVSAAPGKPSPVIMDVHTASPTTGPTQTRTPAPRRATITPWAEPTLGPSLTPITPDPYMAMFARQPAENWRDWPIVAELPGPSKNILIAAVKSGKLDLHAFSKAGDCQLTPDNFLGGYARGEYRLPADPGYKDVVAWFSDSMKSESITARQGLSIGALENPLFGYGAGYKKCRKDETPLACELRLTRPVIVIFAMGTNWGPNASTSFEIHLRNDVNTILASGALPILATKADNVERDWKLNEVITKIAYEYELPLVNVWRAVQDAPNQGLRSKDNIHLNYQGAMLRNQAWLAMLRQVYLFLNQ